MNEADDDEERGKVEERGEVEERKWSFLRSPVTGSLPPSSPPAASRTSKLVKERYTSSSCDTDDVMDMGRHILTVGRSVRQGVRGERFVWKCI